MIIRFNGGFISTLLFIAILPEVFYNTTLQHCIDSRHLYELHDVLKYMSFNMSIENRPLTHNSYLWITAHYNKTNTCIGQLQILLQI